MTERERDRGRERRKDRDREGEREREREGKIFKGPGAELCQAEPLRPQTGPGVAISGLVRARPALGCLGKYRAGIGPAHTTWLAENPEV